MLACLNAIGLLDALLVAFFNNFLKLLYVWHILVATNDVLQVFEQACFVLILRFWTHKRNLLNFTLKD